MKQIDFNTENQFKNHLNKDEKILWASQPEQGIAFFGDLNVNSLIIGLIILAMIATMQKGFEWYNHSNQNERLLYIGGPILVISVCILLIIRQSILGKKSRKNKYYCYTNSRIIILNNGTEQFFDWEDVRNLEFAYDGSIRGNPYKREYNVRDDSTGDYDTKSYTLYELEMKLVPNGQNVLADMNEIIKLNAKNKEANQNRLN